MHPGQETIVWEVMEYAHNVTSRYQRKAMIELAFLQERFGAGFLLSPSVIREHVQFANRDKRFRRVVQELVRDGHVACDQHQRYHIVRTWATPP